MSEVNLMDHIEDLALMLIEMVIFEYSTLAFIKVLTCAFSLRALRQSNRAQLREGRK